MREESKETETAQSISKKKEPSDASTAFSDAAEPDDLQLLMPGVLDPSTLKSQSAYVCAEHTSKEAFCLCVKCGRMMCGECCISIMGRRYCEQCMTQDEGLINAYTREALRPKILETAVELQTYNAPKTWREIPRGLINLAKADNIFFATASRTPFYISFTLAVFAVAPAKILELVLNLDSALANLPTQYDASVAMIKSLPLPAVGFMGLISTFIYILLIDFIFFACVRIFTRTEMKFRETSSVMHYCLLPFILIIFEAIFKLTVLHWIAVVITIFMMTTAVRASTRCTILQGFGAMLAFILLTSLLGIM